MNAAELTLSLESMDVAPPSTAAWPPSPVTVEDTGLEFGFLADLTLKMVHADANCTTERIAEKLKLSRRSPTPFCSTSTGRSSSRSAERRGTAIAATACSTAAGIAPTACSTSAATSVRRPCRWPRTPR